MLFRSVVCLFHNSLLSMQKTRAIEFINNIVYQVDATVLIDFFLRTDFFRGVSFFLDGDDE